MLLPFRSIHRTIGSLSLGGLLCVVTPSWGASAAAPKTAPRKAATAKATLSDEARIVHALNRLAFGPRPDDVEAVRRIGLQRWIDQQLHPETIDDSALEAKLSTLSMLRLPSSQLRLAYEADSAAFIRLLVQQKPSDQAMNSQAMNGQEMNGADKETDAPAMSQRPGRPRNKGKTGNALISLRGLDEAGLKPPQRELLRRLQENDVRRGTSLQAVGELLNAKIARAAESKKQLQEVLVDFWSNHFNLDVKKGFVRTAKIVDDREVIRPHVLGRFRDLLGASAKSPAMLFYLDNFRSTRAVPMGARPQQRANAKKMRGGVNENYARELMELHTLGVDGGYTQQDVQEVARCLTGWTFDRNSGEFTFKPFLHDGGEKTVLGHKIAAGGGIGDGEQVLDILALHPATARHLSRKLCVRLVSDDPAPALVERVAQAYLQSSGDLRQTVQSIIESPEFFSASTVRSKIKSPFELAVSAVRALDGSVVIPNASRPFGRLRLVADGGSSVNPNSNRPNRGGRPSLAQSIAGMGQPLFSYQAPTGYAEDSRSWVSTGSLIARLNFMLALSGGQIANVEVEPQKLLDGVAAEDADAVLNRLSARLLNGQMSPATRATLKKQMAPGTPADAIKMTALVLGTPEFQRR